MKKTLILATALITTSLPVSAEEYYIRIDAGVKIPIKQNAKSVGQKMKNANDFTVSLAVGKFILEKVRAEIIASVSKEANYKSKAREFNFTVPGSVFAAERHKTSSHSLMLRVLPDFYDFGRGKLYAIAGFGISKVGNNTTITSTETSGVVNSYNARAKAKYNPTYTFGIGNGFYLHPDFMIDVAYAYVDAGKTKSRSVDIKGRNLEATRLSVRSHNVTAGIRFMF